MKKGIFLIILVSMVSIYIYTKKEPQKAITVTVKKNKTEPLPSEQNTTVVKEVKTKKPIVHKSNEQNETNETTPPKMCLVGLEKIYFSFQSYTFDEFGHVKTVTTDRNKDGKPETKTFLSYDERGNLIKSFTERYQEPIIEISDEGYQYSSSNTGYQDIPTEIVGTTTMSYDEDNHLIDKIKENNSVLTKWHYGYDEQGNVNYKVFYMNDELIDEVQVINRYDKENHLLSVEHKFLQYSPKVLFHNGEFANYEYRYDKKGQLVKKIDPSYYRVFEYSYDESGYLIKEDSYRNKINQPNKYLRHLNTLYYKYDKLGHLIKIDSYRYSIHNPNKNLQYSDSTYYKYDKYGNLIEESNSNGEILLKQRFEICK